MQGSTGLTPKQKMLAELKAKADARKNTEGLEQPPKMMQDIEATTKPVSIVTTQPPSLKNASKLAMFANAFRRNEKPEQVETFHRPFAVVGDPDILTEANVPPSDAIYALEKNLPQHLRQDYEFFKNLCTQKDIPAGMMSLMWQHLLNDLTIIEVDTSYSMGMTDVTRLEPKTELEKNFNVEVKQFGENREGYQHLPNQTRMQEAQQRLREILPLVLAANRQGIVHLKTLSDRNGLKMDMRSTPYQQAVNQANAFISRLQPDLDHTPSVSTYYESCIEAVQTMRSGRVASTTIVDATDGEPNEKLNMNAPWEQIYQNYLRTVVYGGQDYRREDGYVVKNAEARRWNMDQQTPELMRRLSVLAGHFAHPTTFAACTNNDEEIGELNEIDTLHNTVAVLDDLESEQAEVIRQQGPRFPFNLPTYMAMYFIGPKEIFADAIDERPLTPDQLESYLGWYPGHEAYMSNLNNTQTAVLAKAERTGFINQRHITPEIPPTAPIGRYTPQAGQPQHLNPQWQQPQGQWQPPGQGGGQYQQGGFNNQGQYYR